jgi:hypothetical protein
LYAEVVQTGIKGGRAWIRPLVFLTGSADGADAKSASEWIDVRGCVDMFLPEECLNPSPDAVVRARVAMTMAAFEFPHEEVIGEARSVVCEFVTRVVQGLDANT